MTCHGTSFSLSLINHECKHDVFLSFRGKDTRNNFTGHLYNALCKRGISTFMDDGVGGLERGEEISQSLFTAIEESRISLIVFSQAYASSTWCLEELEKILECRRVKGQLVLPVFYGIHPSEVRHQTQGYEKAMEKHEERFKHNLGKVQKWRLALDEASRLAGWHFENEYEYELIEKIVKEISSKLNCNLLHIANYPVGLDSHLSKLQTLLDIGSHDCVQMVGICGLGGIGKSTIARAVYNSIAGHFECTSFLADVRENSMKHGLEHLQKTLLYDLLGEKNIRIHNKHEGISKIRNMLRKKMVLLILDDVDKKEQLETLAGGTDWFGFGSRIIITTRDKQLLVAHQVKNIFKVEELDRDESLELFSWNAFRKGMPDTEYADISDSMIRYAEGLPLALEVMGSDLCGKGICEWESFLERYKTIPPRDVFSKLKISYDNLEDDQKEIFLDIACFFKWLDLEYVIEVLDACGFNSNSAIGVLVDKCLLTIETRTLRMHDLIQDMGREIVRRQSPKTRGKRTRLWFHEDVLQVLQDDAGTDKIEGIMLHGRQQQVDWSGNAFKKMKNLRILILRNAYFSCGPTRLPNSLRLLDWENYPSPSLPHDFRPRKLVVLNLPHSNLKLVESSKLGNLTCMNLSECQALAEVHDVSGIPHLRELDLSNCKNLVEIHNSVGLLNELVVLSASGCDRLKTFPHSIRLTSLEFLHLDGCSMLKRFPEVSVKMENIRDVSISGSGIEELPFSIENLVGLSSFIMSGCKSLRHIPWSINSLPNLLSLRLSSCPQVGKSFKSGFQMRSILPTAHSAGCSAVPNDVCSSKMNNTLFDLNLSGSDVSYEDLSFILSCSPNLILLDLSNNNFKVLPECIAKLARLRFLSLRDCKRLQHISRLPSSLGDIEAGNCTSLTSQSSNTLLSQAFSKTDCRRKIIMPGSRVPEWFDHIRRGGHISFWFRSEFPNIIVGCLLCSEDECSSDIQFLLSLNGHTADRSMSSIARFGSGDHLWLLGGFLALRDVSGNIYRNNEWNHVQISFECTCPTIKSSVVYVDKKETNMEDVLFRNPSDEGIDETIEPVHVPKRNRDDENVGSFGYPLHKKQCIYHNTSAFETMEQQQRLTSTHQIFGGHEMQHKK